MGSPIPQSPTNVDLSRMAVGRAVSAAHTRRWCDDLNFLRGRVVACVGGSVPSGVGDESGAVYIRIPYHHTPGIVALRVEVTLRAGANNQTGYITVTSSEGTTWILHNGLDGSRPLIAPSGFRAFHTFSGVLDISGHSDVLEVITLKIDPISSAKIECSRFLVEEIALADTAVIDYPTSEPGINAAWPIAPTGQLIEGDAAEADGYAKVLDELENARYRTRRHCQWAHIEYDPASPYLSTSGIKCTTVAASWGSFTNIDGSLQLQARELYSGTADKYTVWIRYLCSVGGKLRIGVTPVGGSTTNTDVTLSASAVWATATVSSIDIPATGTNAEVEISLQGQVSTAGSLYIANFALIGKQD